MTKEELTLIIAESLVEPRFPQDPMKEAENIAFRIERRLNTEKSNAAIDKLNEKKPRKPSILDTLDLSEEK